MSSASVRSRTTVVVSAVVVAMVIGVAARRATPRPATFDSDAPYTPWIESRAPGVFDSATQQLRGLDVGYRVDAHVLLPLGFTSLEIWSSPDVGTAVASYRDCQTASGEIFRGYELFSASRPERARGLDRQGFFREAIRLTPGVPAWTVYFGAMTSSPERTYREAFTANDSSPDRVYEATDGYASGLETRASVFRVMTDHRVTSPSDLYAAVRPWLSGTAPRLSRLTGSQAKPLPALAFLGALQASLRAAAVHRDQPPSPSATRVPFVHNGSIRQLELLGLSPDPARGRPFTAARLAHTPDDVYLLRYRIVNPGDEDGSFRLWAELPPTAHDDPQAPPIPPLAWEIQVRSFLRLYYERTR
jgi:hypothetical protein